MDRQVVEPLNIGTNTLGIKSLAHTRIFVYNKNIQGNS